MAATTRAPASARATRRRSRAPPSTRRRRLLVPAPASRERLVGERRCAARAAAARVPGQPQLVVPRDQARPEELPCRRAPTSVGRNRRRQLPPPPPQSQYSAKRAAAEAMQRRDERNGGGRASRQMAEAPPTTSRCSRWAACWRVSDAVGRRADEASGPRHGAADGASPTTAALAPSPSIANGSWRTSCAPGDAVESRRRVEGLLPTAAYSSGRRPAASSALQCRRAACSGCVRAWSATLHECLSHQLLSCVCGWLILASSRTTISRCARCRPRSARTRELHAVLAENAMQSRDVIMEFSERLRYPDEPKRRSTPGRG